MRKTLECRKIELYCDFHGHSTQRDVFFYGCTSPNQPLEDAKRYSEQVFPKILDGISPNFSFDGSSFTIHKSKESTGRVVMWKDFGLRNSYTCEASFCGPS